MDIDRIRGAIAQMKLHEKLALSGGGTVVSAVDRKNIGSVALTDELLPYAAKEPSFIALGCTFSETLCAGVGKARSVDAARSKKAFGGVVSCGLITDPMRQDACEFFSEDPVLTAKLLKSYASAGVIGYVFTDALGQGRYVDRTVDSRALYELYLYPLIKAGRYAAALQLDGGYLNGKRVGASRTICDIVSSYIPEYAMVMTQYGDVTAEVGISGNGAYQLGADGADKKRIAHAVVNGEIFENKLNRAVERTLSTVVRTHEFYKKPFDRDAPTVNIVYDSSVLLENDGTLPLATKPLYFGDAKKFDDAAAYALSPVTDAHKKRGAAKVFLITDYADGVPEQTAAAIAQSAAEGKTVVVLCGGGATALDFADGANAVMYCPYCPSVYAVDKLLTEVSPRGRLPFTWCRSAESYPRNNKRFADRGDFRYESVFNGYALFNNFDRAAVRCPFGHGLDYAKYEITKFSCAYDRLTVTMDFVVKNVGALAGTALCQAYVTLDGDAVYGLKGRLAAFKRVALEATENAAVRMVIDLNDLSVYDERNNEFAAVGGKYRIDLGFSSWDIRETAELKAPIGSRVNAGLNRAAAPSYFAYGRPFEPTAPEIEKLLRVPFIKKPDEHPELIPDESAVKKLLKKAEKTTPPRLLPSVRYKIKTAPTD